MLLRWLLLIKCCSRRAVPVVVTSLTLLLPKPHFPHYHHPLTKLAAAVVDDDTTAVGVGVHRTVDSSHRRQVVSSAWTALLLGLTVPSTTPAAAFETIGKDPLCNTASCLGVWDGLLADCPHTGTLNGGGGGGAGCVATQDDTPGIFSEPWDYSDDRDYYDSVVLSSSSSSSPMQQQQQQQQQQNDINRRLIKRILDAMRVVAQRRGDDVHVLVQEGPYLRVTFTDGRSKEESVGEFYLTPNDTTVQFRVASMVSSPSPRSLVSLSRSLRNKDRLEQIRTELRFEKVPVLRNRSRLFWFVESDEWDTFGPSSNARLLLLDPLDAETRTLNGPVP